MKILILSFSPNKVSEESYIPNEKGLTFTCVDECISELKKHNIESEHICMNYKNIKKCLACGKRGWGECKEKHECIIKDDFNDFYHMMGDYDGYIFATPVYFWEMSESAKTFFDRLKRCDSSNEESKIKGKKFISIACAGGTGNGTENTLHAFDILNHFMKMDMIGRIPVTRFNCEEQKQEIKKCVEKFIG